MYKEIAFFHSKMCILNRGCKKLSFRQLSRLCFLKSFHRMCCILQSRKKKPRNAEQVKPCICKTTWYLSGVSFISCYVKCSLVHLPQHQCRHYHPHGVAGLLFCFCCCNPLHVSVFSFITVTFSKGEMKQQASFFCAMQQDTIKALDIPNPYGLWLAVFHPA